MPVVYIGYNTGVKIPYEGILREVFKQYVDVKNVLIKQAPSNSGLRSFALVEFMDVVCFFSIIIHFSFYKFHSPFFF